MTDTEEIKLIKEQTAYMDDLLKKLSSKGEVMLNAGDTDTIEQITQTLNWFRMHLAAFEGVSN